MSDIEIVKNEYNTSCDIYGCSNIGTMIIGEPNQNLGQRIIICPECLQNIINAAPIDMILNRPELAEVGEDEFIPEDSINGKLLKKEITEGGFNEVGKALEGEEVKALIEAYENCLKPKSFDGMSFTELKKIAVEKGLQFKVGMGKDYLIEFLEGK